MQTLRKVLDNDSSPGSMKSNTWYLMRPNGYLPEPRVGHTATYLARERKVIFIGGANPNMVHQDTWSLDLSNLICSRLHTKGDFQSRYEHCAFVAVNRNSIEENSGNNIWVFGGADLNSNMNDLWQLNVDTLKWSSLIQQGDVPCKRTVHSTSSLVKDKLTVFGGGDKGGKAVEDRNVYCLNHRDKMWKLKTTTGNPPEPRQGHAVIAAANKLYVHGGMCKTTFYDDLHILNETGLWTLAPVSDVKPPARASHGAALHKKHIYMFGGLSKDQIVMNDFWRLDTESLIWQKIDIDGSALTGRLDFAMFIVDLPANFVTKKAVDTAGEEEEVNSVEDYLNFNKGSKMKNCFRPNEKGDSKNDQLFPFLVIHGGMDLGNLYDDFHVFKLE